MDPNSQFWVFFNLRWWPRDAFIIGFGILATFGNLAIWIFARQRYRYGFIAALLALSYGFYIVRGSVILEFYMTPLLPFLALNIGMFLGSVLSKVPRVAAGVLVSIIVLVLVPVYVYTARDHYTLDNTQVQIRQLQWIRANIPANAMISIDDDLWVDLHEPNGRQPVYPNANSYSKIQGDPEITTKLLHNNIRNLDYIVLSDDLVYTLQLDEKNWAFFLGGVRQSTLLASFQKGAVEVEVRKMNK